MKGSDILAAKKEKAGANATQTEQGTVEHTEPKFSKSQLVKCDKYAERRDLVYALLDDGEKYTMTQVDKMIEEFMKGQVK